MLVGSYGQQVSQVKDFAFTPGLVDCSQDRMMKRKYAIWFAKVNSYETWKWNKKM